MSTSLWEGGSSRILCQLTSLPPDTGWGPGRWGGGSQAGGGGVARGQESSWELGRGSELVELGRELGSCRLTIYINLSPPGHAAVALLNLRAGHREQRLWEGEHFLLRAGRQAGARVLRGL